VVKQNMQKMMGIGVVVVGCLFLLMPSILDLVTVKVVSGPYPPVGYTPEQGGVYDKLGALVSKHLVEEQITKVTWYIVKGQINQAEPPADALVCEASYVKTIPDKDKYGRDITVDVWSYTVPSGSPINDIGMHTAWIHIQNDIGGLWVTTIFFEITGKLSGTWYIDGQEITSPDQVVYVADPKIEFKFVQSGGTISTCTVEWSGPTSGSETLPEVSDGVWKKTIDFTEYGSYDVTLTASNSETITMSIYGLNVGTRLPNITTCFGIGLIAIGLILIWRT